MELSIIVFYNADQLLYYRYLCGVLWV